MTENTQKILLAEDDQFLSRAYKDGLGRAGFDVTVVSDGEEAVSKIGESGFDLILLDLIMPKKNGFEVLEAIKGNDSTKNVPVIILSNLGQESDIEKGKQLGAVDYMIKSDWSMKEVISKIKKHLE